MRTLAWRCILTAIAAGILSYQLFIPKFIGLADNGDFPRVAGRLSLRPADKSHNDTYIYFPAKWAADPAAFWDSEIPTSAMLLARAARFLNHGPEFDLRWLAALHIIVFLGVVWCFAPEGKACLVAVLILTDIEYTAYFNSFFLDGATYVFLLATVVSAVYLIRRSSLTTTLLFVLFSGLLISSKAQHALLVIPLAGFLLLVSNEKAAKIAGTIGLVLVSGWMIARTPYIYKVINLWNSVFATLLPHSSDPAADLRALNLGPEYSQFIGKNAFEFENHAIAGEWEGRFYRVCTYGTLLKFYTRRPVDAVRRLRDSLATLHLNRPLYLGNYQRADGYPPGTRATMFSAWSSAKSWIYRHAPLLTPAFYLACAYPIARSRYRALGAILAAMAILELLICAFAASIDDYRPQFLFHAIGDLWLCLAGAIMLKTASSRVRPHIAPAPPDISIIERARPI